MAAPPLGGSIESRRHPAVSALSALRSPAARRAAGLCVAGGPHLVAAALAAGLAPVAAFVTAAFLAADGAAAARLAGAFSGPGAGAAAPPGLPEGLWRVSPAVLRGLAGMPAPQGLLAVFQAPPAADPAGRPPDWVLALDGVQDPGNVGALARSLLAFGGAGALLLTGPDSADPFGEKALRASAGAAFSLRHRHAAEGLAAALADLPGRRAALCPRGGIAIRGAGLAPPLVLVVGSEGSGVSPAVLALCEPVTVPMAGPAESLNAAVAGAIALYEAARPGGA